MSSIKLKQVLRPISLFALAAFLFSGNPRIENEVREYPFAPVTMTAVDSIISQLSDDERIAQMFILKTKTDSKVFPGGYLMSNAEFDSDDYSFEFILPPFVGLDFMQPQSSSQEMLSQELLAAADSQELMTSYLTSFFKDFERKGINYIIGPSLDLNTSSNNPYTNFQSFGDSPEHVGTLASSFIKALRKENILCVAGSFPGIGSADRGFESSPPLLYSKKDDFNFNEFIPFKMAINQGLQSILVANVLAPGLDSVSREMASGSKAIIDKLRTELGYKALIWADLSQDGGNKEISRSVMNPILAGADIIIIKDDLDKKIKEVNTAIKTGVIGRDEIDDRVKRIIQSKLWMKKNKKKTIPQDSVELSAQKELAIRNLVSTSMSLLSNKNEIIPITHLDTLSLAVLSISDEPQEDLNWLVNRYSKASVFSSNYADLEKNFSTLFQNIEDFDLVIVLADEEKNLSESRLGLGELTQSALDRLVYTKPTIFAWAGKPNALRNLNNIDQFHAILECYENTPYTYDLAIQAIFGGRSIEGELKRKVKDLYDRKTGIKTEKIRLAYGIPEEVGIPRKDLNKLDEIAQKGIDEVAYPGCQLFFAKDGVVVVNKSYGHHQYDKKHHVAVDDLYDIASITKIAASTAGLLKLNTEGKFSLDSTLAFYLGERVDTTDYGKLTMREILAHQAGLAPFVPFYSKTLSKGSPKYDVYSLAQSDVYPNRVAREFYIKKGYEDVMFDQILEHPLSPTKEYKYSDIGYYFALRIIEKQGQMAMDKYLDSAIYRPLGLTTMSYKPLERFSKLRITPTEYDRDFRNQLIHGDVHDPGAAMLGGVGGHAGLFSNANDLGILMQMYLNGGKYGGAQLIDSTILADYIRCQYCENHNRRGAGFDKPLRESGNGPSCGCTDKEAFGHQGFTGTTTWADPGENIVYVFLSNRVYPKANNRKLAELNIRTDLQQVFYNALNKGKEIAKNESQN